MVAEVQKLAAVPCAVPSAESLAANRLPKGTRHARAAEGRRDFHIPLNSLAAREFMARPMIARGFRQMLRSGERSCLQPIWRSALPSRRGVRHSTDAEIYTTVGISARSRRTACGVQHSTDAETDAEIYMAVGISAR
ncbi:MAG: hypothetical protein NTV22_02695, partial [bacterium]|nr:hypothetical protein [bacterium]